MKNKILPQYSCMTIEEEKRFIIIFTRSLGYSAPLLLAPAEGWRALRVLLWPSVSSSVPEGAKEYILNLVSK